MPGCYTLRGDDRFSVPQAGEGSVLHQHTERILQATVMLRVLRRDMPQKCARCGTTESPRFYEVNVKQVCSRCVIKEMMIQRPTNRQRAIVT